MAEPIQERPDEKTSERIQTFRCSSEFNDQSEEWSTFLDRFELELRLKQLTENTPVLNAAKRDLLLKWIGPANFKRVSDYFSPRSIFAVSYDEMVTFLNRWHCPPKGYLTERRKFRNIIRQPGQNVTQFINELRSASKHCKFGESLEEHLRDQFLFCLNDAQMQEELLKRHPEGHDTLQEILESALLLESAVNQRKGIQCTTHTHSSTGDTLDVNKVSNRRTHTATNKNKLTAQGRSNTTQHTTVLDARKHCLRCGNDKHNKARCPAMKSICRACKQIGHWERVCIKAGKATLSSLTLNASTGIQDTLGSVHTTSTSQPTTSQQPESDTELYNLNGNYASPILVPVQLNGKDLCMEVDSGAALSVISLETFNTLWSEGHQPPLEHSDVQLHLWNKENLPVMGQVLVDVIFNKTSATNLPLVVARTGGRSLLGRNWFQPLGISVSGIMALTPDRDIWTQKYPELFGSTLGRAAGPPVSIVLKDDAQPMYLPARSVPLPLRKRVEEALDNMTREGTLEPVQFSSWATPIVPVFKQDGSTRICMDYRSTVNAQLKPNANPLPAIRELLTKLSGAKIFSTLDMAQAYLQLPVDQASAEVLTVNTHKGLYRVRRLPFGLAASPGIFQKYMENLLVGIPGITIYLDDIVVSGEDEHTHQTRLDEVLRRMNEAGLCLKMAKCHFNKREVEILGFKVSAEGIRPTLDKIKAIKDAPQPGNKSELRSFLGLVNFYNHFLKDKATIAEPLHRLLKDKTPWNFGRKEAQAFNTLKELITSHDLVLAHYSLDKELVVSCDASSYGLGAVLSHVDENCRERPIAFASRTLSDVERRYAQIDREGLAVIFAVQKFHNYIAGRKVTIHTDHKPLVTLFDPKKTISATSSPRMQRWSLFLANYMYDIRYRPGAKLLDADACSRLPLSSNAADRPNPAEVLMLESSVTPIASEEIQLHTARDRQLQRLKRIVMNSSALDEAALQEPGLRPYKDKLHEISTQQDCLLWGHRVIIPVSLQQKVLQELHATHPGIVQMKMLARGYVWWGNIDKDIEKFVKDCQVCRSHQHLAPREAPSTWAPAEQPWERLHMDIFGPLKSQYFLLVVDAFSKWTEVEPISAPSTEVVVRKLRRMFATHGLPKVVVSDNATTFTSSEFQTFLGRNGIHHITSPVYHPASNGLAERFVQSAKSALTKLIEGDWATKIARFLLHQHNTPTTTTNGMSPAEILFGRKLRTALDTLKPQDTREPTSPPAQSKPSRSFEVNDEVSVAIYKKKRIHWEPGRVTRKLGGYVYLIRFADGTTSKRHINHLRPQHARQ